MKANDLYDSYKQKKAQQEKDKRKRAKESLAKLPKSTKEELLKIRREQCRDRVKMCRQRKKGETSSTKSSRKSGYRTLSALMKAVAKAKRALPSSPTKRKAVITKLFHTFNEEEKQQIIDNNLQLIEKVKTEIVET